MRFIEIEDRLINLEYIVSIRCDYGEGEIVVVTAKPAGWMVKFRPGDTAAVENLWAEIREGIRSYQEHGE
jgi:hypothetical protein